MINLVLVDDHQIVRNGLKMVLEGDADIHVIGEASDGTEVLDVLRVKEPDILLADIRMPKMNGLELTPIVKKEYPNMKVLILTMHDDSEYILQSVHAGADGYILKDTDQGELLKAIRTINDGHKYFSGDISETIVNSFVRGYKNDPIVSSSADSYGLTKREKEILGMIKDGISNKSIAEQLGKSVRTIETHRFNIMKKLGVNNIAELLKKTNDEHLID